MNEANATDVVWIASYPKSGNTWINEVIRTAAQARGEYEGDPIDVHDLINMGRQPQPFRALARPDTSLLKTHAKFARDGMHTGAFDRPFNTVGFIHIYRNPLDVLLSYINFTRIEYANVVQRGKGVRAYQQRIFEELLGFGRTIPVEDWQTYDLDSIPRENLDHALREFSANGLVIRTLAPMAGGWKEHTDSWLQASQALPSVTLRYEDCLADPGKIGAIARHFTFDESAVLESNRAVSERSKKKRRARSGPDGIFFNKMQAFYFSSYFSARAIGEFMTRHEAVLREYGYADLLASP